MKRLTRDELASELAATHFREGNLHIALTAIMRGGLTRTEGTARGCKHRYTFDVVPRPRSGCHLVIVRWLEGIEQRDVTVYTLDAIRETARGTMHARAHDITDRLQADAWLAGWTKAERVISALDYPIADFVADALTRKG